MTCVRKTNSPITAIRKNSLGNLSFFFFRYFPFPGILAVSAILFIVMGILVTMFFSQIIDNFIYKVNF